MRKGSVVVIKRFIYSALFIAIIISTFYVNQGCKIEIFEPTPTLTPTLTPIPTSTLTPTPMPTFTPTVTPTPNKDMVSYFKDAKKIIDKFKNIATSETKIINKMMERLDAALSDQDGYNAYVQFLNEMAEQEKNINKFKKDHPKDYIPDFTLFIEKELSDFKDAAIILNSLNDLHRKYDAEFAALQNGSSSQITSSEYIRTAGDVYKRHLDVYGEIKDYSDGPYESPALRGAFVLLCGKGEEVDKVVNQLFNQGIITCSMGKYFYK